MEGKPLGSSVSLDAPPAGMSSSFELVLYLLLDEYRLEDPSILEFLLSFLPRHSLFPHDIKSSSSSSNSSSSSSSNSPSASFLLSSSSSLSHLSPAAQLAASSSSAKLPVIKINHVSLPFTLLKVDNIAALRWIFTQMTPRPQSLPSGWMVDLSKHSRR